MVAIYFFAVFVHFLFNTLGRFRNWYWSRFCGLVPLLPFIAVFLLWINFNESSEYFQQIFCLTKTEFSWLSGFCFGMDGISLVFSLLTTFLTPLCLVSAKRSLNNHSLYTYNRLFIVLEFCVVLSFLALDFFVFYLFFEVVLIPMFLIILVWGSSERRFLAALYFFFFTLAGSLFLLVAILALYFDFGTDYYVLYYTKIPLPLQLIYWWLLFVPFAVKIPMFPFHIWLPEAHVEAPTSGSMFLAAVLLKLGAFGFIRYLLPLFPEALLYYQPFVMVLALVGVYYTSFIAIRQIDIKRIIAYSSIAHMNFALLGLFSLHLEGFWGSLLIFIGHGFVSAALFFLVGVIYDRYKTRLIFYYTGLTMVMPLFSTFFFLFSLGNIAFPGTVNFVGEFLVLASLPNYSMFLFFSAGGSLFFALIFTFWLYTRTSFGTLRILGSGLFYDLLKHEAMMLLGLFTIVVFLGISPQGFFDLL